jgi:hypothetical protein
MYDPEASDSPHLSGAQPTWGDLPYACQMLTNYWKSDGKSKEEITQRLKSDGEESKVGQLLTLLGEEKLGLIRNDGSLSPNGIWIADNFEPPSQQGINTTPGIGTKEVLSATEQSLLRMLLFDRNWLPMLATINMLAEEDISSKETKERAEEFSQRVGHLDGYQNVNSINSWKKKVQAHLAWAMHLDFAYETHNSLKITGFGQQVHESVESNYHPDWP